MTIVRRPSPFGELLSLRQAMDRLFDDSVVRPGNWAAAAFGGVGLPIDISMNADELRLVAQLPGVNPEDVEITVENGTLTIKADSTAETSNGEADFLVQEIRRGTVSRTISLPNGLEPDKAEASFEHGQLTLRIPKADEVKPRQIRITPSSRSTNGKTAIESTETTAVRGQSAG
jgi:HSP20 family protein